VAAGHPRHLAGWPIEQHASSEVRWYYFLSMGHYMHLFVTQFFEPKRKDWWEMFIHHIVTMLLLFFSYLVNFVRIGTVVLLCHDGSDIFLELAKLFNYLRFGTLCDVTFTVFAFAFFVGRLVLYPWRVVYVAMVLGSEQVGIWRGFYIFVVLLLVLQVLHLFWFYTIVCMVYSFAITGGVEKDVREDQNRNSRTQTHNDAGGGTSGKQAKQTAAAGTEDS
jgi:ceramide synthetase